MKVNLERQQGSAAGLDAHALLKQHLASSPAPLLAWAEPLAGWVADSGPGRLAGFHSLQQGQPDWPADVPLAEFRLFWADRALHVVAEPSGCRWALLIEHADCDTAGEAALAHRRVVLTINQSSDQRELERFGLQPGDCRFPDQLELIEYLNSRRVAGWRLLPVGEGRVAA